MSGRLENRSNWPENWINWLDKLSNWIENTSVSGWRFQCYLALVKREIYMFTLVHVLTEVKVIRQQRFSIEEAVSVSLTIFNMY